MKQKLMLLMVAWLLAVPLMLIDSHPTYAQTYETIVTQRGDTLSKLARRYCTTWREIYNINRQTIGPNPNILDPGIVLNIPNRCGPGGGDNGGGGGNIPGGVYDRGPRTGATGMFDPPSYTVAWGDNLGDIARRFGVSVDLVRQVNDMWDDSIWVGMILTIPGTSGANPEPVPPGVERVDFYPGSISATRSSSTAWRSPKVYLLNARAGQQMEVYSASHGDPLALAVTGPNNTALTLNGMNYAVQNSVWTILPTDGDYYVSVQPAVMPEGPELPFDITFVIR